MHRFQGVPPVPGDERGGQSVGRGQEAVPGQRPGHEDGHQEVRPQTNQVGQRQVPQQNRQNGKRTQIFPPYFEF